MSGKILPKSSLTDVVLETSESNDEKILENAPNLSPEDCSLLVYSVMGYHLGKNKFFGLTFSLEDHNHLDELRALSNGYIEIKDGIVKMGVLKLENLEKILRAPYIKPRSVQIGEHAWCVTTPERSKIAQIKEELDMRRARIKMDFERRKQEFEKDAEQNREKINAYKKKRAIAIARIEQNFDKKTAAILRKQLGEKNYGRLQQWLLERRKKDIRRFESEIQLTDNEDYDRQLAKLDETDPDKLIWIYYLDNESKFRRELERDIGTGLNTSNGPICVFQPRY